MIIEILLGVIVVILALMGVGILSLRKRVKSHFNLSNIKENSDQLMNGLVKLRGKLDNYKPEELVEKVSVYRRLAERLDGIVEKIYKPGFVKTLQNVEMIKQYTHVMLHILYKYGRESKEVINNKLGRVMDALYVLDLETAPYENVKGVQRVSKYKPLV